MAVFRVERNGNYTVMANYHLKDRNLSLKAKGLLSVFLSLPDKWDYTLKGFGNLIQTHSNIRNPTAYLTKCLYNATMSMNNHMDAKAREAIHRIEEREKMIAEEEEIGRIINGFSPEFWEETRRRFSRSPSPSLTASSRKGKYLIHL